jgi:hypothetical protein
MAPARLSLLVVLGLAFVTVPLQSRQTPSAYLTSGNYLQTGEYLLSLNKSFIGLMQQDGNFCVYMGSSPATQQGPAIWCSNATGQVGKYFAIMHPNGNFCVGPGEGPGRPASLWCTDRVVPRGSPSFVTMNGDGNLIAYAGTPEKPGAILWNHGLTYSYVNLTAPAAGGSIQWTTPDQKMCPPDCSKILRVGSSVTLTAGAPQYYAFSQWTSGCSGTTNPCTLTVAPGGLQRVQAAFSGPTCPSGQTPLDGACVTLVPWEMDHMVLPEGTRVVLKLTTAYRTNSQPVPWPKYLGVQASGATVDATDTDLTTRNVFTVTTVRYVRTGDIWYRLRASNGMYVAKPPGQSVPTADADGDNASVFSRTGTPGWLNMTYDFRWRDVPSYLPRPDADQRFRSISPQTYNGTNIGNWPELFSTLYPLQFFTVQ